MTRNQSRLIHYVADARRLPLPNNAHWLTSSELAELHFWSDPSRRQQWLAGRWIAKRLVARSLGESQLARVEILSRDTAGLGMQPRITLDGISQKSHLSISHAGHAILVGWSQGKTRIGVDLAVDVPQDETFLAAWFSPAERNWIAKQPAERASIVWGLKEAVFKACNNHEKWNPAAVTIDSPGCNAIQATLRGKPLPPLATWIRPTERGMATVVWQTDDNTEVALCS
ncbi:4'-phosphopantetheinyl transferase family protein [Blastopirellula marina]|uniref:4'-phosphopantetheinyl transferase domain-containing protein n=1 Tax=Blastopirellula marina TaxID=124 RepID=A0A2S8G0X5_9BACT|nr:4'-phosphopantetheinyl transferase family protein [Blastopirellula marina]PQO38098.1 hypothetical protein C5Y98_08420 [Blastopirellula marina]PTL44754.1 hypothetical protein C5Y97_08420 [Blastopirellula marina]